MQIRCSVPSLLRDCTGGQVSFVLEADTLGQALEALLTAYPMLRVHLFTETGEVRKHVLLFYNDTNLAWLDSLDVPLKSGDCLTVFQAVSGG